MDVSTLTHSLCVERCTAIQAEITKLGNKTDKSTEDRARLPVLMTEFRAINERRLDLEHDAAIAEVRQASQLGQLESGSTTGPDDVDQALVREPAGAGTRSGIPAGPSVRGGSKRFRNPWDITEVRTLGRPQDEVAGELRERAFDAIEQMRYADDKVREASTSIIEAHGEERDSHLSRMVLATTSPAYMRAFTKLVRSRGQMAMLNSEEIGAYQRAMSLTDGAGGYLIPFQLDPTVILTANGSRNRIRQVARVVTATGDVWSGISSAGVTGSWDAEAAEVSDDAPTMAQPVIPIFMGRIFVPISIEASQDEANVANEISTMVAFEKDRMESVAFVTGSGTGEPTGIVTALTGTSSVIASATADTFAAADVYNLDGDLPARYADSATWVAHRKIFNLIRRFDTQGGAQLWETLGNGLPPTLLGQPHITAEAMDGVINALAENYVAVYGDFSNYVIADRIGVTIEYIPHLFGTNRRPTGQRGWFAWFRGGADSVNDAAFRMLNVT